MTLINAFYILYKGMPLFVATIIGIFFSVVNKEIQNEIILVNRKSSFPDYSLHTWSSLFFIFPILHLVTRIYLLNIWFNRNYIPASCFFLLLIKLLMTPEQSQYDKKVKNLRSTWPQTIGALTFLWTFSEHFFDEI